MSAPLEDKQYQYNFFVVLVLLSLFLFAIISFFGIKHLYLQLKTYSSSLYEKVDQLQQQLEPIPTVYLEPTAISTKTPTRLPTRRPTTTIPTKTAPAPTEDPVLKTAKEAILKLCGGDLKNCKPVKPL